MGKKSDLAFLNACMRAGVPAVAVNCENYSNIRQDDKNIATEGTAGGTSADHRKVQEKSNNHTGGESG